jgi:hypothetical protein
VNAAGTRRRCSSRRRLGASEDKILSARVCAVPKLIDADSVPDTRLAPAHGVYIYAAASVQTLLVPDTVHRRWSTVGVAGQGIAGGEHPRSELDLMTS